MLEILEKSNDIKPVRVVTQVNTAQEITPRSREAFRRISKSVSAVLNQDAAGYHGGQSELFVFSDAPRFGDEEKVAAVRNYLRTEDFATGVIGWFR